MALAMMGGVTAATVLTLTVPAGTLRPCVQGRSAKWPRSAIGWRLESGFKNAISFPSLSVEEECVHALFDRYEARRLQPPRHAA